MKTLVFLFIFLLAMPVVHAQMLVETPTGERRIRYTLCNEDHNCRVVEQTVSYPVCDEHHICRIVDVSESESAKLWEEEELLKSGTFVFSVPAW